MSGFKIDDFRCDHCERVFEDITAPGGLRNTRLCRCGEIATRIISAPAVQTIETHMRSATDSRVDAHGGYHDYNLRDLKTGAVPYITSKAQKARIMREKGVVEMGSVPADRERSRKGTIYST